MPSKATSDELVVFDLTPKGGKEFFLFLPTFRREEMLRISHFGEEFYIEGKHHRSIRGNWTSPPEPAWFEVTEICDANGNPVSEELFDEIAEGEYPQILDAAQDELDLMR